MGEGDHNKFVVLIGGDHNKSFVVEVSQQVSTLTILITQICCGVTTNFVKIFAK